MRVIIECDEHKVMVLCHLFKEMRTNYVTFFGQILFNVVVLLQKSPCPQKNFKKLFKKWLSMSRPIFVTLSEIKESLYLTKKCHIISSHLFEKVTQNHDLMFITFYNHTHCLGEIAFRRCLWINDSFCPPCPPFCFLL